MLPEQLQEFRSIYSVLFGDKKYLEITPEVVNNPRYSRYKVLAVEFYTMMIKNRKKHGLKI